MSTFTGLKVSLASKRIYQSLADPNWLPSKKDLSDVRSEIQIVRRNIVSTGQ